ncbi:unnamed protein product, partial [Porites lobata]
TPDKESFSRVAKFLKIHGEILEVEQELYASFRQVRGLDYMTVPEMVHENDLFNIIPTCLRTRLRAFIALGRVKTYLRSTMGQQRVSNIALIKIERAYANSVVNN